MSTTTIPTWTLADRLRKARELAELSQGELAELMGRSRNTIGNYEAGRTAAPVEIVAGYAEATGVDLSWIITGRDENGLTPVTLRVLETAA